MRAQYSAADHARFQSCKKYHDRKAFISGLQMLGAGFITIIHIVGTFFDILEGKGNFLWWDLTLFISVPLGILFALLFGAIAFLASTRSDWHIKQAEYYDQMLKVSVMDPRLVLAALLLIQATMTDEQTEAPAKTEAVQDPWSWPAPNAHAV